MGFLVPVGFKAVHKQMRIICANPDFFYDTGLSLWGRGLLPSVFVVCQNGIFFTFRFGLNFEIDQFLSTGVADFSEDTDLPAPAVYGGLVFLLEVDI